MERGRFGIREVPFTQFFEFMEVVEEFRSVDTIEVYLGEIAYHHLPKGHEFLESVEFPIHSRHVAVYVV